MGFEPISIDQTAASGITVPSSETNLKTLTIRANSYNYIWVRAVIKIASTGTSSAQNVTFRAKPGVTAGNTKSFVFVTKAAVDTDYITIDHIARSRDKDDVRVTVQGAGADANTTVTCESMTVFGIY